MTDIAIPAIQIVGSAQVALVLTAATVAATAEDVPPGIYTVWCDVLAFIKVAPDGAAAVTLATGYPIPIGAYEKVQINPGNRLSAISASGGTLRYHKVG